MTMSSASKTTNAKLSPLEVARETIKQMALKRVEPNPENYQVIYNEIAGIPAAATLASAMQKSLKQLPHDTTLQIGWINRWEKLLKQQSWDELPALLADGMEAKVTQARQWPDAIRELLRAWDAKRVDYDGNRKKETLERVLIKFGQDEQLAQKLQNLAQTWLQVENKNGNSATIEVAEAIASTAAPSNIAMLDEIGQNKLQNSNVENPSVASQPVTELSKVSLAVNPQNPSIETLSTQENTQLFEIFNTIKEMYKQSLKHGLIPRLEGYPDVEVEAQKLLSEAEKARKFKDWQQVSINFRSLLVRVEVIGANEVGIRQDILGLLKLLVDNISELVAEDQWLRGQVAVVQTILSSPLDRAMIQSAEKSLKEIIFKQGTIKHSLVEAKAAFKHMLATFVDRLSYMSQSSGEYQEKITDYSNRLSATDDIFKINEILEGIMTDTHVMQTDIVRSRELLVEQRDEAMSSQEKIRHLQDELTKLSEVVRVDQLTGVLNRRGFDEAVVREISRVTRGGGNLCVAMLDVDNFKHLNDTHGHHVGDEALQHLAKVIQDTVRPTDVISRYGGEEFVILLPETNLDDALIAITRLQRSLTKRFFLGNHERIVITFSAGIALYKKDEDQVEAINRADQAMYLAKKAGKNRVLTEVDLGAKLND